MKKSNDHRVAKSGVVRELQSIGFKISGRGYDSGGFRVWKITGPNG